MRQDETPELIQARKMYVVVRGDLPPGLRAAQAGHAIVEACLGDVNAANEWHNDPNGNYLIILEVPGGQELLEEFCGIVNSGVEAWLFREVDLAGQATAFSCLPSPELNYLLSHLPLAYAKRTLWGRLRNTLRRKTK